MGPNFDLKRKKVVTIMFTIVVLAFAAVALAQTTTSAVDATSTAVVTSTAGANTTAGASTTAGDVTTTTAADGPATTTAADGSTTTAEDGPGDAPAEGDCSQHDTCTTCRAQAGCKFCAASNTADATTAGELGTCVPDANECGTGKSEIPDTEVCLFDEESYCEDTHDKCIGCTNDERCHWCSSIGSTGLTDDKDIAGSRRTVAVDCKVGEPLKLEECDAPASTIVLASAAAFSALVAQF